MNLSEEHFALFVLNQLGGIGAGRKRLLTESFGSAKGALEASIGELMQVAGIGRELARKIHDWRLFSQPEEELRLVEQSGVGVVFEDDEDYPPLLREIHDPPICLYVLGNRQVLRETQMGLAVVGSRHCSAYGEKMTAHFATGASQAGWPVVSGLARGVDTVAHNATLAAGGKTIAVIGSGLMEIYPQENIPLAARIAQAGGAVISEFPMRFRPERRTFPMRNRIISGICRGTLVVEAGKQSGSLITAAQALEQGRMVFAVPGRADTDFASGCHALIRDGATLVERFGDIAEEYTLLPGLERPPRESQSVAPAPPDVESLHLTGLEGKLWEMICQGTMQIDELMEKSGEEPQSVLAALMTLELRGLVRQMPGRQIRRMV